MPNFTNLKDVRISKDHDRHAMGLFHATALAEAVDLAIPHFADPRTCAGSVIVDGQRLVEAKPGESRLKPSFDNYAYGRATCIERFSLPDGVDEAEFNSEKLAAMAIDALLDGRWQFEAFKNYPVQSGIYHVGDQSQYQAWLMVTEATFGRVLAGISYPTSIGTYRMDEPRYILLAMAQALTRLFPRDNRLEKSVIWTYQQTQISARVAAHVKECVDEIFENPDEESFIHSCKMDPDLMDSLPFDPK